MLSRISTWGATRRSSIPISCGCLNRQSMTSSRRPVLFSLLAAWVAVTVALTMMPSGYAPPPTLGRFLCVACGTRDVADIILNWMLFLPGGALVATAMGGRRTVALTICFTVAIEALQIGVPGRYPALQDLIFNTLGALSGVVLIRKGLGRSGQRLLGVASAVAWLAPLLLLIPKTSPRELYGLWTPSFGNVAQYEGRILDASVDGLSVESRIFRNKSALDAAITQRKTIQFLLEVGPPPPTLAPVFQVNDGMRQEVLMIGALGPDLVLRGRNPARILRLDQPDARWPGAMLGFTVGDTVTIVVDRGRQSVCMSVATRQRCDLAPSLADGWGHLLYTEGAPAWLRTLVTLLWASCLGVVLGAASGTRRAALAAGMVMAVVGYAASHLSPDVRPDELHAALLAGGSLLGARLRLPIGRLWRIAVASEDVAD